MNIGGGVKYREQHVARKKLLPRDRIDKLLDPGYVSFFSLKSLEITWIVYWYQFLIIQIDAALRFLSCRNWQATNCTMKVCLLVASSLVLDASRDANA